MTYIAILVVVGCVMLNAHASADDYLALFIAVIGALILA